jgi:HSP20 family protein
MLMRFDPFREIDRLAGQLAGGFRGSVVPMDLSRHDDSVVARFDLPGVAPESIQVTVERDVLQVSGTRGTETAEGSVLVSERPRGTFTRQVSLGRALDTEHIGARYDNGVLTVTIPLAEKHRARRIEVQGVPVASELESASPVSSD